MNISEIEVLLENWHNHYKDNKSYRVTQSLEGKYRPEGLNEEDKPVAKPSININDACDIEKIIIGLPHKNKCVLVAAYMYKYLLKDNLFFHFCRKASIKPSEFDSILKDSKMIVLNRYKLTKLFK